MALNGEDSRRYARGVIAALEEFRRLNVVKWVEGTFRDLETFHPEVLPIVAEIIPVDLQVWVGAVSPASLKILEEA